MCDEDSKKTSGELGHVHQHAVLAQGRFQVYLFQAHLLDIVERLAADGELSRMQGCPRKATLEDRLSVATDWDTCKIRR